MAPYPGQLFLAVILVHTNEGTRDCTCNLLGIHDACHNVVGLLSRGWTMEGLGFEPIHLVPSESMPWIILFPHSVVPHR